MKTGTKSAVVGFAVGLALAGAAAQAAQHEQHAQPPAPSAQVAPVVPAKPMMMGDPAKHQQMMEQMGHCRDMMSKMMEHMKQDGQMPKQPPVPPKQ